MPKVLQINTVAVNGSTGRITEGIGEAALNRGYDSYVAFGRNNSTGSKSKLIRIGTDLEVNEHVLETRILDRQGLASCSATRKFVKQLKQIKPDLVHLHNIHGNYLNYQILFRYLAEAKIPVVWTIHDCWPITGHCVHFTAVKCNKWKTGCFNCPRSRSYPQSLFADRSKKNYSDKKTAFTSVDNLYIVPVSNWLGGVMKESFLGEYPIQTIHNGIDITSFYSRPDSVTSIREKYNLGDKFVILGVATGWSKENGLYDFIELRKLLDDNYIIVLVGVTDKVKEKLPEGIIGIYKTDSQAELAELYTTANIFVNGSFEETFGLVTAEAMACGTPVIVYNSTACPEIVKPEVGYVIPVSDVNAMKDAILLQKGKSEVEKTKQSEYCTKYALENFDKRNKFNEYVDMYDKILNRI